MSTDEGNDNAVVAATDKMKELSHEDSDESRSREDTKDLEAPDRFLTHNIGDFNGAYNNEKNVEELKRSQVLERYLVKHKPLLLNLIEIRSVTRKKFQEFADKMEYKIEAINYPGRIIKDGIEEFSTKMTRAAAILVRKDSGRKFETILDEKKANSYTIVGVRDTKNGINHFCCYIHNTIKRTQMKTQLFDALVLAKEAIYKVVKLNLQRNGKIDRDATECSEIEMAMVCEEVKKEKVIVSGDFNIDIDYANSVLSSIKDFVCLEDKLYFKWPTRKIDENSYSKVDYLLAANVHIMAHKPVENYFDHHTMFWDINRAPTSYENCYNIECDFEACADPSLLDVTMPEKDADQLLTYLVSLFLTEAAEQMFPAPVPSSIKGSILAIYLDKKVFGEENHKTKTATDLDPNKVNWICAFVILLEDLKSFDMRVEENKCRMSMGRRDAKTKAKRTSTGNSTITTNEPASP